MITSYQSFIDSIGEMIKIRSRNFVNTNCDIEQLVYFVYNDIMTLVNMTYIKDRYKVDGSGDITIRIDNRIIDDENNPPTQYYGTPTDIVTDSGYTIMNMLQRIDEYTYRWIADELYTKFDTQYIYFVRPMHYDVEHLPSEYYSRIMTAMVEGIMYNIEVTIPSQGDGQLANLYYQKFFNAKADLMNRFPQVEYVDPKIPKLEREEWQ